MAILSSLMAGAGGLFLFNMLCSMVPCDMKFRNPEIIHYRAASLNPASRSSRGLESNLIDDEDFPRVEYPVVETRSGAVRGYTMTVASDRKVFAFEGIPFGESTGGRYRFRAPAPKRPWNGIRNAMKPGAYCAQLNLIKMLMVTGSEDCLFLNIFTPKLEKGLKLPVLIQIHGGSFIFGAGHEYGPSYLMAEHDMIFITINYRQGILGFFSTGDEASPGNYGLKDQALALKWIHENIEAFGGDPQKVTIMGQSGGAVSVHLHLIANVTRQYFQRAISLSGTGMVHWGVQNQLRTRRFTEKVAKRLRCPLEPSTSLVECLRSRNFARVAGTQMDLFEWVPFPLILFGPAVEPQHPEAFLTETPDEAYERGNVAKIPWIASIMAGEGYAGSYVFNLLSRYYALKNHPRIFLPIALDTNYIPLPPDEKERVFQVLKKLYFGDKDLRTLKNGEFGHELGTDRYFAVGISKGIKAHYKVAPTYAYILSYLNQYNIGTILGQTLEQQGVCHGEDMFFYMNSSYYSRGFKHGDPEYRLSQIMINLIVNFMKKGEPLYTEADGKDVKIWDKVTDPRAIRFLDLDKEIKMVDDPFKERVRVWESLGLPDTIPLKELAGDFRSDLNLDFLTSTTKSPFTIVKSSSSR